MVLHGDKEVYISTKVLSPISQKDLEFEERRDNGRDKG